jgi:hypothetical protein
MLVGRAPLLLQPLLRIEAKCAPRAGGWRYLRVCRDDAAEAADSSERLCCEIQRNDQNCTRPARKFNLALVNNQQHGPGAKLVLILYTRQWAAGLRGVRRPQPPGIYYFAHSVAKLLKQQRRALWKHSHFAWRAPGAT